MIRADRVLAARQARQWTQRQLAQACDTDVAYISKLERSALSGATVQTLERLAEALDVSTDYLLGLSDTPHQNGGAPAGPRRAKAER
jgi:transcriptional regulator with XRE-family HTH domain